MFYQRKNYEEALDCYKKAGMHKICTKIIAMQYRQQADDELHNLEREY